MEHGSKPGRDPSGELETLGEVARETNRHLRWMRDAGERGVPALPALSAPQFPGPSAPAAAAPTTGQSTSALVLLREEIGECQRCKLHEGRTHLVFGVGNPRAELLFVGEGPGADEDLRGEPFVGRAGQLLDRMIGAMGLTRPEVYICNIVKCRPPGNRNPEPDEINTCLPFLKAQIAAVNPRVIVALGKVAAQTLLGDASPISRLRGHWREALGKPLMPTFHPAYLLRSPGEKAKAWEDLKAVLKALGRELPAGPRG
jgi:uracil-DNA glycosylase family 4